MGVDGPSSNEDRTDLLIFIAVGMTKYFLSVFYFFEIFRPYLGYYYLKQSSIKSDIGHNKLRICLNEIFNF